MVTWANADKLASWKKLLSLKGMVSVAEELSCAQAADRIAKYSIPVSYTHLTLPTKHPV